MSVSREEYRLCNLKNIADSRNINNHYISASALNFTNMVKKNSTLVLLSLFLVSTTVTAQNSVLDIGIRLQKTVNLYLENGISVNYSNKNFKPDRWYFGFSYVTSRLGTAMGTTAIKQDNFLLSSSYFFGQKKALRPFVRANVGFFSADYGDKMFDVLPSKSPLLSLDLGLSYKTGIPLKLATSLGYNFITGNGLERPGTLYPVFYQLTASWNVFSHRKS
jgi:hypothetical protein